LKDVLQYLLGAGIVSVLLTQVITVWRAEVGWRRERDGLLRILATEVSINRRSVAFLLWLFGTKNGAAAVGIPTPHARTEAWEATRMKLAQHLTSKEFASLAYYYKNLVTLEEETHREGVSVDVLDAVHLLLNRLDEQGMEVQGIIRKYVPDVPVDKLSEEDVERLARGRPLDELLDEH